MFSCTCTLPCGRPRGHACICTCTLPCGRPHTCTDLSIDLDSFDMHVHACIPPTWTDLSIDLDSFDMHVLDAILASDIQPAIITVCMCAYARVCARMCICACIHRRLAHPAGNHHGPVVYTRSVEVCICACTPHSHVHALHTPMRMHSTPPYACTPWTHGLTEPCMQCVGYMHSVTEACATCTICRCMRNVYAMCGGYKSSATPTSLSTHIHTHTHIHIYTSYT